MRWCAGPGPRRAAHQLLEQGQATGELLEIELLGLQAELQLAATLLQNICLLQAPLQQRKLLAQGQGLQLPLLQGCQLLRQLSEIGLQSRPLLPSREQGIQIGGLLVALQAIEIRRPPVEGSGEGVRFQGLIGLQMLGMGV